MRRATSLRNRLTHWVLTAAMLARTSDTPPSTAPSEGNGSATGREVSSASRAARRCAPVVAAQNVNNVAEQRIVHVFGHYVSIKT
jgi:phage tail tape-measure protein